MDIGRSRSRGKARKRIRLQASSSDGRRQQRTSDSSNSEQSENRSDEVHAAENENGADLGHVSENEYMSDKEHVSESENLSDEEHGLESDNISDEEHAPGSENRSDEEHASESENRSDEEHASESENRSAETSATERESSQNEDSMTGEENASVGESPSDQEIKPATENSRDDEKVSGGDNTFDEESSTNNRAVDVGVKLGSKLVEERKNDSGARKKRETLNALSMHRLPVQILKKRYKAKQQNGQTLEMDIIAKVMCNLNTKHNTHYVEEHNTLGISEGFKAVVYVDRLEKCNAILQWYGVDGRTHNLNYIIFYHRKDDIYALTAGSSWMFIQSDCCHDYDFPLMISQRVTSGKGNLAEKVAPVVGNNRMVTAQRKNATESDELLNIRQTVTRLVRENSSLFWLKEFREGGHRDVKITRGFAFFRFERKIDFSNIPEILDHFSKIVRREVTFSYPDKKPEQDIREPVSFESVSGPESSVLTGELYLLLRSYFLDRTNGTRRIKKLDFVHKYVNDYCSAPEYTLWYKSRATSYKISDFSGCPNVENILVKIHENCLSLNPQNRDAFINCFKNHIKISFKQGTKVIKEPLVSLLEGEMEFQNKDYYRKMGKWLGVTDELHRCLHQRFVQLLIKPDVFIENKILQKSFRAGESVTQYCNRYNLEEEFFNPPILKNLAGSNENCFFDLLRIRRRSENFLFDLIYVFDHFGPGIRDASSRVNTSVERILKTESRILLQKFWAQDNRRQSQRLQTMFNSLETFIEKITNNDFVRIIVAFVTGNGPGCVEYATPTLKREKELFLEFDENNLQLFIEEFRNQNEEHFQRLCNNLGINADIRNETRIVQRLLMKLHNVGYAKSGTLDNNAGTPIMGKLLKLRASSSFQLVNNDINLNQAIFSVISKMFLTGFPGFTHKLEVLNLYAHFVGKKPELRIIEIADCPTSSGKKLSGNNKEP